MDDREQISIDENYQPPEEPADYGWFGGILEGSVGDRAALGPIVDEINRVTPIGADLEIDGGRFTVLLDDQTLSGDKLTGAGLDTFVNLLRQLAAASATPDAIESTLRYTGVHGEEVVEILFARYEGEIRCISRRRPLQPADREHAVPGTGWHALPSISRKRVLTVAALLLVVFGLLAWQNGLLDRILLAKPADIVLDTGPFKAVLTLELESHWGIYSVTIRRGEDYPATAAEVAQLQKEAVTAMDRAAMNAVANGSAIHVQLQDRHGKVIGTAKAALSPLLAAAGTTGVAPGVVVKIPGRMDAHAVRLALDAGVPGQ